MVLSARDLALHLCRCAREKGGEDLAVLAMPPGFSLFDFSVLVNGRSDRQVHTLVGEAQQFCKHHHITHHGIEGESGWLILDCGDVVFHAFLQDARSFYALDRIWTGSTPVEVEAALAALPVLESA